MRLHYLVKLKICVFVEIIMLESETQQLLLNYDNRCKK